jgi:methylated-DNA-[protein]-cysteine S-methyltransferase
MIEKQPYQAKIAAPFAVLGILTAGERLAGIDFLPLGTPLLAPWTPFAREVCRQLREYLRNPGWVFDLPLAPGGTPFQRRVWQALREIPPGATRTYGEVAAELHSAPRAVGGACGTNPIPLVIPCHRVTAKTGLGGFMGSVAGDPLRIKRWLLRHEDAIIEQ